MMVSYIVCFNIGVLFFLLVTSGIVRFAGPFIENIWIVTYFFKVPFVMMPYFFILSLTYILIGPIMSGTLT